MTTTATELVPWCRKLLGAETQSLKLEDYLAGIGRLATLSDLPAGTAVLVRGDVDAKPGAQIGDGDIRLRSMVDTLQFGRKLGWKQIVFGHIGRKPEGSLKKVAGRLGELLGCSVPLIDDWCDDATGCVKDSVQQQVAAAAPGSVLVLENTRKYQIERVLWDATAEQVPALAERLATFANDLAKKIARVFVNEALSAGSLDTSSTVVPAAMDRVALGNYVAAEFDGPMRRCLEAQVVVFSGLKTDKLDDLQAMIDRGHIRKVFTAGSLAMALKKADALNRGQDFGLGVAEDPAHADKPYYIEPARIEQAREMLRHGQANGIEFVLPVDFVLADGSVSASIGPGQQQFDIGPATSQRFADEVGRIIADAGKSAKKLAVFHNGVFGMFEDPRFEAGTKAFIGQLKRMTDAGLEVFIGGGEGGAALEKYGQDNWVTHCFTAGGTVLNALGGKPVPYLQAMYLAAHR